MELDMDQAMIYLHVLTTCYRLVCSSDCCPGLQCGYEAGLSWGDSDLHLHCDTGVCCGVGC